MGFGLMGLMGIVPLLVLGLIIWAVVEATRSRRPDIPAYYQPPAQPYVMPAAPPAAAAQAVQSPAAPASVNALAILDDRYARGEIDRDEYLQRRRDLTA
ncbi:MAG: hypothetical protein Kow00122_20500 [Thermoleophilia bacterium]